MPTVCVVPCQTSGFSYLQAVVQECELAEQEGRTREGLQKHPHGHPIHESAEGDGSEVEVDEHEDTGHALRRSACHLSEGGRSISELQAFFGWTNPKTAQEYLDQTQTSSSNIANTLSGNCAAGRGWIATVITYTLLLKMCM